MDGLSKQLDGGYSDANEAQITQSLRIAYREVFSTPSGQVAIVDLALYSGWDKVSDLSIGPMGLAEANGMRKVFKRIFDHMNFSAEQRAKLAEAVKQEEAIAQSRNTQEI
jgi:hypothetical protein